MKINARHKSLRRAVVCTQEINKTVEKLKKIVKM